MKHLSFDDLMPESIKFSDFVANTEPSFYTNFLTSVDESGKLFFMILDFYILLTEFLTQGYLEIP